MEESNTLVHWNLVATDLHCAFKDAEEHSFSSRTNVSQGESQVVLGNTCKLSELVQCGEDWRVPPLQEEHHHDGEGEVGDPGAGDAAGDAVSSGPASDGEHEAAHPRVQLSV